MRREHPDSWNWPEPDAQVSARPVSGRRRESQERRRVRRNSRIDDAIERNLSMRRQAGFDRRPERYFACQQDECYHIYHDLHDLQRHTALWHPSPRPPDQCILRCMRCCGVGCEDVQAGRAWHPTLGLYVCTHYGCSHLFHSLQSLINHTTSKHHAHSGGT